MRRTLPRVAVLLAAIVSIAAAQSPKSKPSTPKATAASQRDAAGLQAKIDAHLAAGEVQQASALVPQFIAAQERALAADTVAMVLGLRTCAEGFIAVGPEGAAAADTLLVEGLNLRTAHFGPDHLEVAKSYNMLSVFHEGLGHYETATQYKIRALDIRSRQLGPEDLLVARTQHEFGVLDLGQGQFRDAGPHFEAALAVFDVTPPPDSTRLVALLNDVAELRRIETRYAAAESCLQRSLALGSKLFPPDDPQHADQLNNLAGLYKDQGRYEETEALLDRAWAMRIAATPPDSGALATAALNLAETYRLQDRPKEAAPRYEQATLLASRALGPDHPDLVWFLNQSAVFHAEQGEVARAERLYRDALGILARAGGPAYLEAQTEHDLAALLETTKRHAGAESLYTRALATREELLGSHHPDVALTLIGLGQCVAASDPKRRAEAGRCLDRAAAILDSTNAEPEGRVEVHATRARLRAAGGNRPGAIDDMQVALEQVEALRPHRGAGEASRVRFLARHSEDAADLVDWCLQEGDLERAIETVERSRARAFLDRIAAAPLDPLAAIPPATRQPLEIRTAAAQLRLGELQQQLAMLRQREDLAPAERRRRIAKLEAERDTAAAELQRAQDAMLAASPVWRTAVAGGGSRISAAEIARRAPHDGLIVMYQVAAQKSHVIAIPPPPARPEAWELQLPAATATRWKAASGSVGAATLDRALGGHAAAEPAPPAGVAEVALAPRLARVRGIGQLQEVASPAPAATGDPALSTALYEMWQVLMPAPLWEKVRRASEVVVVPDAALCQLPFEALVVERPDAKRAPRYWLDAGPIVRYALSGMSLVVPPRPGAAESVSALGLSVSDPAYPSKGPLEPLPATARETAAIQAAFEPAPLTVLQGSQATEPHVRTALAGKRYVHLATHGVVDRAHSELLSGLAFTPPAKPSRDTAADGMLQLFEIYDLHLDCDLAVLSACETSAGAWVEGEGVYALSRGFLAAGAKQVVASLWSVEDESTAALVGDLFREIAPAKAKDRKTDLEVARALRDAKRRIRDRKEWNAPFYWAPFVLTTRQ